MLDQAVGRASGCVSDILRAHGLKPHLVRTYKVSRDPAFAAKVTDVVGLYLQPPEHVIVLSVDEKTSIQVLERTPTLPLRTGRAVRHTHDYRRHGGLDLFAALEIATGTVTHQFSPTHTAADFLRFMKHVVRAYPARELHVVLNNSSAHNTEEVRAWLGAHPRAQFHYTPTSASWLHQVEGFFGILTKQSLSVTNFPSKRFRAISSTTFGRGTRTRRPSNGPGLPEPSSSPTSGCLIASQRRCSRRHTEWPSRPSSPTRAAAPVPDAVQRARDGVGLSNTRARLEYLYPGRHALRVDAPPAGGFAVTISVPGLAVAPDEDLAEVLDLSA